MSAGTEGGASTAVRDTAIAGVGCGCLLSPLVVVGTVVILIIFGGFGVLLAPLIALIMLFQGGGDTSRYVPEGERVIGIARGDGAGELDPSTVPQGLADPIEDAGELCDAIGPVVIAAQIEQESGFDASKAGEDGEKGLSQLPPDVFDRYGEDDDDNDEVSALDAADSIMAQGRYMCDLAGEAQKMIDAGEATGTVLDLSLAAYHVGMDAVREARGLPSTQEATSYVLGIRARFALYQGIGVPPPTPTTTPPSPEPTGSGPTAPTA
ncbi:transglycosylase SLT domain-containing protein [Streptomyces sp. CHD11]|uniref:transglycosylase SLT domain-containing protein n=1 Tax=Streptomyces sp. CHD11 TaxID=2741325 RepID=UPI001BFC7E68|nr:transglycosylase SLT domain-containing protein [Streptomyces sp. CHD11]MBT3154925.1 transglycosylase SLT domain-containing protein [Streptomyces sp. CHD11]